MPLYEIDGLRPSLAAEGAWVAPSADAIGDVRLGPDASMWFGAVARGDNTPIVIGARSNVQEGAMLHSDPGAPLTIGEDCTIADLVLIGMGAIVLNRAVIGHGSIVGAGALVTEGKVMPPNSLIVGSPARVVRTLDDQALTMLRLSAQHYVEKSRACAKGLRRID